LFEKLLKSITSIIPKLFDGEHNVFYEDIKHMSSSSFSV